ncbi:hypothetical protein GA0070610_1740 [Micromonospora echinofusca]|uniref:Uncharacterized protein n=1 Tax=Micromonospora echinofusca TaxID=47858 RepID=A0A1C5G911_MICEH|nr:hypothetical protein GA0070610_1740 [Micromonospora echinofusca]
MMPEGCRGGYSSSPRQLGQLGQVLAASVDAVAERPDWRTDRARRRLTDGKEPGLEPVFT